MNMMSKIYASAAASPVALEGQGAAPYTITLPLPTAAGRDRWDIALATYIAAKAKYDALPTRREDDEPAMFAMMAAEDELIMTPAPDLAALQTKVNLEYFRGCLPGDAAWKAIQSDVERLAADGVARLEGLSPAMTVGAMVERGKRANDWIDRWEASGGAFHLDAATQTPVMGHPINDGQEWSQTAELMQEFEAAADLKPVIRAIVAGRLGGSI